MTAITLNYNGSQRYRALIGMPLWIPGLTLSLLMLLMSALGIVYLKQYQRQLFHSLRTTEVIAQVLHEKRSQLLVEQSAWAMPARIQRVAERQFRMHMPTMTQVILVKM